MEEAEKSTYLRRKLESAQPVSRSPAWSAWMPRRTNLRTWVFQLGIRTGRKSLKVLRAVTICCFSFPFIDWDSIISVNPKGLTSLCGRRTIMSFDSQKIDQIAASSVCISTMRLCAEDNEYSGRIPVCRLALLVTSPTPFTERERDVKETRKRHMFDLKKPVPLDQLRGLGVLQW